jgi:hypothetical protein
LLLSALKKVRCDTPNDEQSIRSDQIRLLDGQEYHPQLVVTAAKCLQAVLWIETFHTIRSERTHSADIEKQEMEAPSPLVDSKD